MAMQIVYFEDYKIQQFNPLTFLRPLFMLRAGILPLYKRCEKHFSKAQITLTCREHLAPIVADSLRDYPVNIIKKTNEGVLLLNSRIRSFGSLRKLIIQAESSTVFYADDEPVAIFLLQDSLKMIPAIATMNEYNDFFNTSKSSLKEVRTDATLYNYCWDLMADIEKEISDDYDWLNPDTNKSEQVEIDSAVSTINKENIFIGDNVKINPGVVLDASKGPIFIGNYTTVEAHAAIYGPTVIGPNSVVLRGKLTSSSIGHTCRVGGEVENSIFQSYVNKYHDGFIGHSYVGSWVNFGAMTTNSDLKNNYSTIRTKLNSKAVDTHSKKVGSFIGDHTKFGIGTLLNTGINIGICSNLFGGTLITDKEVKSFSWGGSGNYKNYDVEKAIETANIVYGRRNATFSDRDEQLIRLVHENKVTNNGILIFE